MKSKWKETSWSTNTSNVCSLCNDRLEANEHNRLVKIFKKVANINHSIAQFAIYPSIPIYWIMIYPEDHLVELLNI